MPVYHAWILPTNSVALMQSQGSSSYAKLHVDGGGVPLLGNTMVTMECGGNVYTKFVPTTMVVSVGSSTCMGLGSH